MGFLKSRQNPQLEIMVGEYSLDVTDYQARELHALMSLILDLDFDEVKNSEGYALDIGLLDLLSQKLNAAYQKTTPPNSHAPLRGVRIMELAEQALGKKLEEVAFRRGVEAEASRRRLEDETLEKKRKEEALRARYSAKVDWNRVDPHGSRTSN
ncbi:hypothetical protein BDV96DRAFT_655049 [Lophiotrema nucula]|uniref:Uncharacterized protein n=1 Tax=Lophiotrema nucula TaxID=690887 RepID=A0A6A5YGF8_9PLEO|nr:hypothetical protein BDV96DRAFT_655049 [Lophiotrema nucula]